jgi:hypothetical protein
MKNFVALTFVAIFLSTENCWSSEPNLPSAIPTPASALYESANKFISEGGYEFRTVLNVQKLIQTIAERSKKTTVAAQRVQLGLALDLLLYGCTTVDSWSDADRAAVSKQQMQCAEEWDRATADILRSHPDNVEVIKAAIRHAGVRSNSGEVERLKLALANADSEHPQVLQDRAARALQQHKNAEALDWIIRYVSSTRVDVFLLRGFLDWAVHDASYYGLPLGDLSTLVSKLPQGEEVEWYSNVGKNLAKSDPAIKDRRKELDQVRAAVLKSLHTTRSTVAGK